MSRFQLLAVCAVSLIGCGPAVDEQDGGALSLSPDGGSIPSDGGAPDGGSKDAGITTAEDPNGPKFLTIGTSVSTLYPNESFTVSAVLTHPLGVDKVIGGVLKIASGAPLGAFQTQQTNGAFAMTLTWAQLQQAEAINFDGSLVRHFTASFFDEAGHHSESDVPLTLACKSTSTHIVNGACDGVCKNLDNDEDHCGACANKCTGPVPTCDQRTCSVCPSGQTQCGNSCRDLKTDSYNCGTCGNVLSYGSCVNGIATCTNGYTSCGNKCVTVATDEANCGACGHVCNAGMYCYEGACMGCSNKTTAPFPSCSSVCSANGLTCKSLDGGSTVGTTDNYGCGASVQYKLTAVTSCSATVATTGYSLYCNCQ